MKKRIVLGSVLIMVMLLPAFSAPVARSSWSTGINLGTGVQSAAQYRINDDMDIMVGIGLDFFYSAIYGDVIANFRVGGFNIDQAEFDVTVGGGVLVGLYDQKVELSVVAPVGITYKFPEEVIPLDLYIRVGPAIRIFKGYQANVLGLYSYIGAMYRF